MTTPPRWRVLQLASTSDMGGTERMILFLLEALDRARFEPYLASLVGGGELIRRGKPLCAAAQDMRFRSAIDPAGIARLIRFIREHKIDLVQTYGLRADTAGRIAARLGGARVVFSSIRSIDPWRRAHHVLLDRATAPLVDVFVSNSEAGKRTTVVREKFSPDRIEVVYSGIPSRLVPRDRRYDIRRELGMHPDAFPVIGILANLRSMKGHLDVIAALPDVLREFPQTVVLFAGRDDSAGAIERAANDANIHHAIRFLGYVEDTAPLLAAMDIFMLPSHWEGLPVSIIEAMHARLPIITTIVGGIPELVSNEKEALLITPASPQQIASAIVRLARDETLRQRLADAAQSRAQAHFSIEAMTSRIEQLYLSHLEKKAITPRADVR